MKPTEFFQFWLPPPAWKKNGKPSLSRYQMTLEQARERFGDAAKPDLLSREVRMLPETPEESKQLSSWPMPGSEAWKERHD